SRRGEPVAPHPAGAALRVASRSAGLAAGGAGARHRHRSDRTVSRHERVRRRDGTRSGAGAAADAPPADTLRTLAGAVLAGRLGAAGDRARGFAVAAALITVSQNDGSKMSKRHFSLVSFVWTMGVVATLAAFNAASA